MSYAFLEKYLEVFEISFQSIFTQFLVHRVLNKSFRLKIVPKLLTLFSERSSVNVICLSFSLNVVSDPFLENLRQHCSQQLLVDAWQFWVHLQAIILLNYKFLAEYLINEWIINEKLVVAWSQICCKNIV